MKVIHVLHGKYSVQKYTSSIQVLPHYTYLNRDTDAEIWLDNFSQVQDKTVVCQYLISGAQSMDDLDFRRTEGVIVQGEPEIKMETLCGVVGKNGRAGFKMGTLCPILTRVLAPASSLVHRGVAD